LYVKQNTRQVQPLLT